jgi:hypothetical protein
LGITETILQEETEAIVAYSENGRLSWPNITKKMPVFWGSRMNQ